MSKLFKVLVGGKSCHGGNFAWSLPTQNADGAWTPGAWHEVDGPLRACEHGLHVTAVPAEWWLKGCEVWVVEVRLVSKATESELAEVQIFSAGSHSVNAGVAIARHSSNVVAWDSSKVVARDSSKVVAWASSKVVAWASSNVVAWDSSNVVAWDSSKVVAWDSSKVVARDSSKVVAWDSSKVVAWDSSNVVAWDSSNVVAWDSSNVVAWDSSTITSYSKTDSPRTVQDYAILIDRSVVPPRIVAGWPVETIVGGSNG